MALSNIVALGVNLTADVIRSSGWVDITDLSVSSIFAPLSIIHGDLINFGSVYIGQKERIRIEEVTISQTATLGSTESVAKNEMYLLLFNSDFIVPVAGQELSFPSGYDEEDILCVIKIPISSWVQYKEGYMEANVQPLRNIKGNITTAGLGVSLFGVLITLTPTALPAGCAMKIKLDTSIIGDADES